MDEIAKLYIIRNGNLYRIKVFRQTIGIESQSPPGDNLLFERMEYPVYHENASAWGMESIDRLITAYEQTITEE
jgi:hypothetical protein